VGHRRLPAVVGGHHDPIRRRRQPGRAGTRLLFSHRDYEPDNPVIPIVTPAWAQILLRLKGYAETGKPQPFFDF